MLVFTKFGSVGASHFWETIAPGSGHLPSPRTMSKSFDQQTLLLQLEGEVERHLAEVIRSYQNLSDEALLQRPPDQGWSVVECLWHLNSYGHHYLPLIEKGLARPGHSTGTFTSTWLGSWFTRIMRPGEGMRKMKAFKDHRPPAHLDSHRVVAEFIHQQEELLDLLRRSRVADLNRIRIGLSILPWLKMRLGDVFQFLIAHQDRHLAQARRVRGQRLQD